jgi:hypothetical protein
MERPKPELDQSEPTISCRKDHQSDRTQARRGRQQQSPGRRLADNNDQQS